MLTKLINRLVGFENENIEQINWKRIWQQLKWMNGFSKGYRGKLSVLTGINIFFSLFGIAYALVYRNLVDGFINDVYYYIGVVESSVNTMRYMDLLGKVKYIYQILPPWIVWVLVGYVVYKIVSYLFSLYMEFFTLRLSMDLQLGIKRQIFATVMESDWLTLTQYRAGDLVQRVQSDAETVSGFAMGTVPSLIVQAVTFVVAIIVMFSMDWTLILMAFAGIPLYIFNIMLRARRQRDFTARGLELGSKNASFMYESMSNIMVIKAFMLVPEFIRRFRQIHVETYNIAIEKTKYGIVTGAISGMIRRVMSGAVFLFLAVRLIDGHVSFGTLTAYSMLASMLSAPLVSLIGFVMNSIEISASAERVMSIYELPRDRMQIPEVVEEFGRKAEGPGMGLRVDNLAFAYEPGKVVLHDVNIEVNPGETVALVGPSGEGKTTLIRLALGLLTPNVGRAYLAAGGETLDLSVETRAFFSYVPQGNTMFSGTVRENLQMGDLEASDERIIKALQQACIWDFVGALPEGLDTKIGERGIGVSEGQAQRLAIARALLRNAPILLLDEATSALDIYTEKAVLENIFASGVCKTCILTTHRPSVFTVCDKIYRVRQRSVELIKAYRDQEVEF